MSKQYFMVVDIESSADDRAYDFAAVITDRKGVVHAQCAIVVKDVSSTSELFSMGDAGFFSRASLNAREAAYERMLENGQRMLASVSAINKWLAKAAANYSPILTAYNLAFDTRIARNTGIDLDQFNSRFCLWHCAADKFAHTKQYRQFIIDNHLFNSPTAKGNMTYLTNAEVMTRFIKNNSEFPDEPHTALEDILDYEIPILIALLNKTRAIKSLFDRPAYNWGNYQVREWFKPK